MLRELNITPVLNGYIVTVGCQTLVFNTLSALTTNIGEYYADPDATEKRFRETGLNKRLLQDQPVTEQVRAFNTLPAGGITFAPPRTAQAQNSGLTVGNRIP